MWNSPQEKEAWVRGLTIEQLEAEWDAEQAFYESFGLEVEYDPEDRNLIDYWDVEPDTDFTDGEAEVYWTERWEAEEAEDMNYDPREDMYWSGTGELMNDESYIDYLNNH